MCEFKPKPLQCERCKEIEGDFWHVRTMILCTKCKNSFYKWMEYGDKIIKDYEYRKFVATWGDGIG